MKDSVQHRSLAGILVVAALLLTGCLPPVAQSVAQATATQPAPAPAPTLSPEKTQAPTRTPTPAPPSALALLEAASDAAKQVASYRLAMEMLMTLSGPAIGTEVVIPITFVGGVQAPDRLQGLVTVSQGDQKLENEIIVIGETTYVKDSLAGQWQKSTASATVFDPKDLAGIEPDEIQNLEFIGEDTLAGVPVYLLTGRAAFPLGLGEPIGTIEGDLAARYWIAREDSRLVQGAVEGEMALSGELEATIAVSMTMRFSDYDVPLEIETPELPARAQPQGILFPPLTANDAQSHLERGLLSLEDDRPGLAAAHFDRAIALQPELTDAYLYRGLALAFTYDELEARADFARVLETTADDVVTLLLAQLFGGQSALCNNWNSIAGSSPDIAQAWAVQGACICFTSKVDQKPLEQAFDAFERARALDAEAADPYYAEAAARCFQRMYDQGAVEQIEPVLARINADVARHPELPGGYLARAEAILWLRDYTIAQTIDAWIDMYRFLSRASCPMGPQLAFSFDRNDLLQAAGERMRVSNCQMVDSAFDDIWDDEIDFSGVEALKSKDAVFAAKWSELERVYREFGGRVAARQATLTSLLDLNAVTFVGETGRIATISGDYYPNLVLWNSEGKQDLKVDLGEGNDTVSFSSDGRLAVTGDEHGAVALWDVASGAPLRTLGGLDKPVSAVSFSQDAALVVAVSGEWTDENGNDGRAVRVWNAETGELIHQLDGVSAPAQGTGRPAESVAITSDSRVIVLADEGVAYTLDRDKGEAIHLLGKPCEDRYGCEDNSHYVALSPDGLRIATAGRVTPVARIWNSDSGAGICQVTGLRGGGGPLAFSPDGRLLAAGTGAGMIGVWDAGTGALAWLGGHRGGYPATSGSFQIQDLAFSLDGKRLITAGTDGAIRIWDVETGEELQIIYAETSTAPP